MSQWINIFVINFFPLLNRPASLLILKALRSLYNARTPEWDVFMIGGLCIFTAHYLVNLNEAFEEYLQRHQVALLGYLPT